MRRLPGGGQAVYASAKVATIRSHRDRARHDVWEVVVAGKPLRCHHCGDSTFRTAMTRLSARRDTTSMREAFVDLFFGMRHARIYICVGCGHVHWFVDVGTVRAPDRENQVFRDQPSKTHDKTP